MWGEKKAGTYLPVGSYLEEHELSFAGFPAPLSATSFRRRGNVRAHLRSHCHIGEECGRKRFEARGKEVPAAPLNYGCVGCGCCAAEAKGGCVFFFFCADVLCGVFAVGCDGR